MKSILSIAALVLFGLSGAAHAATLDIALGNTNLDPLIYSSGGPLSPNIDLLAPSPASLVLTGASQIINPPSSLTNQYAQPTGSIFANSYLAVIFSPGIAGAATFTLGTSQNTFGFTWGTVDDYNTLNITDSRAVTYTITGSQILSNILGSINHTTQSDVRFSSAFGNIVSAQFLTSQNSFEAANFGEASAVPLPAALPLFGAGLLGLVALKRRKQRISA